MRTGKIALVIVGSLVALLGLGMLAAGSTLVWAHATQRDSTGFYTTPTEQLRTSTYALTAQVDFGTRTTDRDWVPVHLLGTVRIRATAVTGDAVFVGIAPQAAVDTWLAGVAHEHVTSMSWDPYATDTRAIAGTRPVSAPTGQSFWVASTSGTGTQTLAWPAEGGRWTAVVMNADGAPHVAVDVSVGAKTGLLLPIGIGLGIFALLLLGGSALLFLFGLRRKEGGQAAEGGATVWPTSTGPSVPGAYPVRLEGHLDPNVSRWQWLVKWVLVIPHAVVLGFLWLAVSVLTVVAGFSILFTGRYPRPIFDFNAAVMRWTWRVSFYTIGAFGTDRYPPFSLQPDPSYPADLTIDYPDHLSRGLVLVKWWLLALPHYLIVAIFAGGWGLSWNDSWRSGGGGMGLIGLLVVIAAVILAVGGRYPQSLFDFVMGMNRWCFRVLAYAALMRDEYPPFRLDSGGTDPGTVPSLQPPPAPDRSGELLGASGR